MSLQNKQIDYSVPVIPVVPSYKFSKLYQQTGGTEVSIGASAQESIFELPTRCINFSRSVLRYTVVPQANNTDNQWFFSDCIAPIRQIQVYTRGGTYLCDINNVDKLSSVTLKAETQINEAIVRDGGTKATAGTAGTNDDSFCEITGKVSYTATTETQTAATTPGVSTFGGYEGDVVTAITRVPNYRYDGTDGESNFEPIYLKLGNVNQNVTMFNVEIPLSLFKNTILELDKDFYFGEVLILKITWNDKNALGFKSASVTAPQNTPLALAAALTFKYQSMALYLAVEHNPVIAAGLIQSVMSGQFSTNIPYVYQFKHTGSATTDQNVTVRLNRAHGKFLKKIYHILYDPAEQIATRYLHTNRGRDVVTRYHTEIDNVRRQEFDIVTADNDDWVIVKDHLRGSLLSNMDTFRYNWFILDKFDDEITKSEDGTADSGLSLDFERKWDVLTTNSTSAQYNHYTFAVVSRAMAVTPQGVFVQ